MPATLATTRHANRAIDMTPARIRFLHKARGYASAAKPTDTLTHELCDAFVEMLAGDRSQHVSVVVDRLVIAQSGRITVSQALR
jgi:hypothetical protein